jgi:hypothetical protein
MRRLLAVLTFLLTLLVPVALPVAPQSAIHLTVWPPDSHT